MRLVECEAAYPDLDFIGSGIWQSNVKCSLFVSLGRPRGASCGLPQNNSGAGNQAAGRIVHHSAGLIRLGTAAGNTVQEKR